MRTEPLVFASIIIAVVLSIFSLACNPSPTPTSEPTPTFAKQPEPSRPQINVTISGLLNSDDLVSLHIYTEDGKELLYGTRQGNGLWEAVVTNPDENEHHYTITAEAKGYTSQPTSYTIRIKDETASLAQDNQTGDEVLDLNFHFIPDDS